MQIQLIQNRIYDIRGEKVMLDFDLALLYEVETRVFNQAVKRNLESFPVDFMFRLTVEEWEGISSSQFVMMNDKNSDKRKSANSSQIVMSSIKHRGAKYLPYAFTEHGVTMLASILKSPKARAMNVAIVRAFIALKKLALQENELTALLKKLKSKVNKHDIQLKNIYAAIENLLAEKENQKSWEERERIGFKNK